MKKQKKGRAIGESIFDCGYLLSGLILSLWILIGGNQEWSNLYGIMGLVLIFGDSFHLIPRIGSALSENPQRFAKQLAAGKLVTSITMTVFYVILWHAGMMIFNIETMKLFTPLVWALAIIRVVLCLLPANRWLAQNPSYRWGIYRNIPFVMLGAAVNALFFFHGAAGEPFALMWIAIALSFIFYIPVVLWANKYPKVGMLMIPKTCVYIWIIAMGIL